MFLNLLQSIKAVLLESPLSFFLFLLLSSIQLTIELLGCGISLAFELGISPSLFCLGLVSIAACLGALLLELRNAGGVPATECFKLLDVVDGAGVESSVELLDTHVVFVVISQSKRISI